ncbi:type IV pilus/biofilm regulator FimL [Kistimonas scapharcae]|uniref:Type IV pilus/biofilm regulator FimL n=1 Tax=Kistimonas scapharcae TaxID=1036133 RepID=A0ABP8V1X8_9GAMM
MAGVNALHPLRDELDATLQHAVQSLEHFAEAPDQGASLQACIDDLQQIGGILTLIELNGAELLVIELTELALALTPGSMTVTDDRLDCLGRGLFILERYLNYVVTQRDELPELLLPEINRVRKARGEAALPESWFFTVRLDVKTEASEPLVKPLESNKSPIRRLRQMYQMGLLGMMSQEKPYAGVKLMQRSMLHLHRLSQKETITELFLVAAACLEAIADVEMALTPNRRILFSRLDQQIRRLQLNAGQHVLDIPRLHQKELLYLLALADSDSELAQGVRDRYKITALPFNDVSLGNARQVMSGPDNGVFQSLSEALSEELATVKDTLDLLERGAGQDPDFGELQNHIVRLGKTLSMTGLHSAANTLQRQQPLVRQWHDVGAVGTPEELDSVAEAVLYVETMVSALSAGPGRASVEAQGAEKPREESHVTKRHLQEASSVVQSEAVAGITLSKRAVTAYLESDYDKIHLESLPRSLSAIAGGLYFLGEDRCSDILQYCARFIREHIMEQESIPSDRVMEVFADVLSSLEFYLESLDIPATTPVDALKLAENALDELGYHVAA